MQNRINPREREIIQQNWAQTNGPGAEAPGPTRVREEDRAFLSKYYNARFLAESSVIATQSLISYADIGLPYFSTAFATRV